MGGPTIISVIWLLLFSYNLLLVQEHISKVTSKSGEVVM